MSQALRRDRARGPWLAFALRWVSWAAIGVGLVLVASLVQPAGPADAMPRAAWAGFPHARPDRARDPVHRRAVHPPPRHPSLREGALRHLRRRHRYFSTLSFLAFEHLVAELLAHGAPAELIESARSARRDEIRHARAATRLATRFGVTPPVARMARTPIRDLFAIAIALENEIEGVVRETLGAAIATWRAEHATDPDVRAVMRFIAQDERRHAELSWQVATWIRPRLDADETARLDAHRRAAIDELPSAFGADPDQEVQGLAGAPRAAAVRELITTLDRELWSAAA